MWTISLTPAQLDLLQAIKEADPNDEGRYDPLVAKIADRWSTARPCGKLRIHVPPALRADFDKMDTFVKRRSDLQRFYDLLDTMEADLTAAMARVPGANEALDATLAELRTVVDSLNPSKP